MADLPKLKDCVSQTAKVTFLRYQNAELWYVCDNGFEFPVPISDCGTACFNATDKSTFFMRWIRRHLEVLTHTKAMQVESEIMSKSEGTGDAG